jgi:hypothetical protein
LFCCLGLAGFPEAPLPDNVVSFHVKEESSWERRVSLNDLVNRALILSKNMMNGFLTDPISLMQSVSVRKQITIL